MSVKMGVNELVQEWYAQTVPPPWRDAVNDCAKDLEEVANTAWKPISNPPSKADGDGDGYVLTVDSQGELDFHTVEDLQEGMLQYKYEPLYWAKMSDVILLPVSLEKDESHE